MPYIYKITNQLNNKSYIGKTTHINPNRRWNEHLSERNQERSQNRALYRAMNKYGVENFVFSVIEETDNIEEREAFYIQYFDTYHNGYNETLGGDGRAYLHLPEQEVCCYYLQCKSMEATARNFNCSRGTIEKILYKNNIVKFTIPEVQKHASTCKKPVAKIDKKTNQIIAVYESGTQAERENKCNGHILQVCQGKRQTAGGFKWKFI